MKIIKTAADFFHWRNSQSQTVGFVPTLGALHQGHLSLVRAAKEQCDLSVVSIFLNPTQFAANEDLNSYPNTLDNDIRALENLSVNILLPICEIQRGPQDREWSCGPLPRSELRRTTCVRELPCPSVQGTFEIRSVPTPLASDGPW